MESKQKSGNSGLIILVILLLASLAGNVYQYFNLREVIVERDVIQLKSDTIAMRKMELEIEVTKVSEELNQYMGRNAKLDSLLAEANKKIEQQKQQIGKMIDDNKDYSILKVRYKELQKLKDEYLKQIDELIEENKKLKFENTELAVKVDKLKEERGELKKKVESAGALKVQNIRLTTLQVKAKGKVKEVDKASKADRINVRFTIMENKLAAPGPKTAFVRIINPQGFIVADVSQSTKKFTTAKGQELPYSRSVDFTYGGESITLEVNWEQEVFVKGTYNFEIYIDGEFAGAESVSLE
jgi:hypothetical protein